VRSQEFASMKPDPDARVFCGGESRKETN